MTTCSHALLSVFQNHGVDRVFLVPGESYLGILDALCDFPGIDVVTCRHESGAGFMAVADARLSGRAGIALASRGPGATNAAIAVHTAQQDAIPMILIVGQVPRADLRREAFQEIDYRRMYGAIAKWVFEVTDPRQLAEAGFKALRIATSGTPGQWCWWCRRTCSSNKSSCRAGLRTHTRARYRTSRPCGRYCAKSKRPSDP